MLDDPLIEELRGSLLLSTDRSRIDVGTSLRLLHGTFWAAGMDRADLARAIRNSVCLGVYEHGRQVALARVVTDLATYAYLTDVVVAEDYRQRGIGSWMVEVILAHPSLQRLRRIALLTRDAQSLYARYGFTVGVRGTSTYMERLG